MADHGALAVVRVVDTQGLLRLAQTRRDARQQEVNVATGKREERGQRGEAGDWHDMALQAFRVSSSGLGSYYASSGDSQWSSSSTSKA